MKFYEVYRDSCGEFSTLEYYRSKKNAETRAKELNDAREDYEEQYDFYGVIENKFEDGLDE